MNAKHAVLEAGKGGKPEEETDTALAPPEGVGLCQHLDLSPVICSLLASRIVREEICVVLSHQV